LGLSKEEMEFVNSINNKIKEYTIPLSLNDCLKIMSGTQVYTIYNDDTVELVDPAIEIYIIKNSFSYRILVVNL
jgi:hypothetical protein